MKLHLRRQLALWLVLAALLLGGAHLVLASHESVNRLTFAPVSGSPSPTGAGTGVIEFKGGAEPTSRWTATFQFEGLEPDTPYSVVVQGRFGANGTEAAMAFSEICSFRTDAAGAGGCWYYPVGLARLNVAQLRLGDAAGPPVLQATRATPPASPVIGATPSPAPGAITSVPNQYSLTLTPTAMP